MKILIDTEEYIDYLFDCIRKNPSDIIIASYGLYAGITYTGQDTTTWGDRFKLASHDLLKAMESISKVRILVGLYPFKSCKGKEICLNCEAQYVRQLLRLLNHVEAFPAFQWRVNAACHIKCVLFNYKTKMEGVAGSRNFGGSEWADISFTLDNHSIIKILDYYNKLWIKSTKINNNAIQSFLEEQKISQAGFELAAK